MQGLTNYSLVANSSSFHSFKCKRVESLWSKFMSGKMLGFMPLYWRKGTIKN